MNSLNNKPKQKLYFGAIVELHSTGGEVLDGCTGSLLGTAMVFPEMTCWIVGLYKPFEDRSAIVITDSCIRLLHY